MIIRFEQSLTVAGFLAEVKRHYGSEEELRRYSKRKPKDILAAEDLGQLAGFLKRDVHNVHEDLKRFQALRVLELERGPGNSRIPRLLAQYITILPTHWEKLEAFKEG